MPLALMGFTLQSVPLGSSIVPSSGLITLYVEIYRFKRRHSTAAIHVEPARRLIKRE